MSANTIADVSALTNAVTDMSAGLNIIQKPAAPPSYVSTRNACKLCAPLGACLVFRGIEGAVPFLHGSQGCATYMRRYIISHFRSPWILPPQASASPAPSSAEETISAADCKT